MRLASFVITAVVVGLSGPAFAQGGNGQQTAANPPAGQTTTTTTTTTNTGTTSDGPRSWVAAGYIGNNFSFNRDPNVDLSRIEDLDSNSSTSANFGGQIAYLGRGVVGGEFLMDFSPGLSSFDNRLFAADPDVNTFMFNLIAVAPFGRAGGYDPYFSGGIGRVSMSSTIYSVIPVVTPFDDDVNTIANNETLSVSGSKFGWNLGAGFMAFSERNWGFRGDVRYYATNFSSTDNEFDLDNVGDGAQIAKAMLSGISFWKINAGLAFRW